MVEYDEVCSLSERKVQDAAEKFRDSRVLAQPARGYRLVWIQVHDPENEAPAFEPGEQCAQKRNQGRRGHSCDGVAGAKAEKLKRATGQKARKDHSATQLRPFSQGETADALDVDAIPHLRGSEALLWIVVSAATADHRDLVPAARKLKSKL
jgi:hypothetical protein